MRAPRRRRPAVRRIAVPELGLDREALARSVRYVGSPEHKTSPSFAGHPRPRADASTCDPVLANRQTLVTRWLRAGIRAGTVSGTWEGGYPRYVWYYNDGQVYEARLVNRASGEYKGYPLDRLEWPEGIQQHYG
jgi:hypothetical protein